MRSDFKLHTSSTQPTCASRTSSDRTGRRAYPQTTGPNPSRELLALSPASSHRLPLTCFLSLASSHRLPLTRFLSPASGRPLPSTPLRHSSRTTRRNESQRTEPSHHHAPHHQYPSHRVHLASATSCSDIGNWLGKPSFEQHWLDLGAGHLQRSRCPQQPPELPKHSARSSNMHWPRTA